MKEYIKGKARIRITDYLDEFVKIEYFHNQQHLIYFRPKDNYKKLVGFMRIKWLKEDESLISQWMKRGKAC